MRLPEEWFLDPEHKETKKLNEIIVSQIKKLQKALEASQSKEDQYAAVYAYYRKYYTLTLCKTCVAAGINKSPTRDMILDIPWQELKQDRIFCLKIWEKINH